MRHVAQRLAVVLTIAASAWIALPAARVPGSPVVSAVAPIAEIRSPRWNAIIDGPVHIDVALGAPAARRFDFRLEVEAADRPGEAMPLAGLEDVPSSPADGTPERQFGATWNPSSLPAGLYLIRLRVSDEWGALREASVPVWVEHAESHEADPPDLDWDGTEETGAIV